MATKTPCKGQNFLLESLYEWPSDSVKLGKKRDQHDAMCPLCKKALEITAHALLRCDKVWEVWWNWQTCPINLLPENYDF